VQQTNKVQYKPKKTANNKFIETSSASEEVPEATREEEEESAGNSIIDIRTEDNLMCDPTSGQTGC